MSIADNIRKLRTDHELTQEEFGKVAGVSSMAVSQWENGRAVPRMGAIQRISDHFHISKGELIDARSTAAPTPADYISLRVAVAGHAGVFTEEHDPDEIVDIPRSVYDEIGDPDAYIIRVRGNCMDRRFADGSNAVASPRCEPRNGDAVVAEMNGELIIRQFFRGASTLVLSPDSHDPSYEDIVFDDPETAEVRFQGVIKWHQAARVRRY